MLAQFIARAQVCLFGFQLQEWQTQTRHNDQGSGKHQQTWDAVCSLGTSCCLLIRNVAPVLRALVWFPSCFLVKPNHLERNRFVLYSCFIYKGRDVTSVELQRFDCWTLVYLSIPVTNKPEIMADNSSYWILMWMWFIFVRPDWDFRRDFTTSFINDFNKTLVC